MWNNCVLVRMCFVSEQTLDAERLAVQPALQQQLDKLLELLERRFDEFALRKAQVSEAFQAADADISAKESRKRWPPRALAPD